MTLRNAFEGLATERSLRNLIRNLTLAKTASDQLRVVIDSGGQLSSSTYWANGNTYTTYYGSGSPGSMDAREQEAEMSRVNFNTIRNQRWSL